MGSVAKVEPAEVVSVEASLLEVIAKAARDPSVDMDKMERLLAMQERVQARGAEIAFASAMAEMQPNLPIIKKNGQIVHKGQIISEFAEWADISKVIKPITSSYGFSLTFRPVDRQDEVAVMAVLKHKAGHTETATVGVPLDTSGAKNAPQSVGSSLSYAKRYAGTLILDLVTEGDDDDGASAAPKNVVTQAVDRPFPLGPAKNKTECKEIARRLGLELQEIGDGDQLVPGLRSTIRPSSSYVRLTKAAS